MEQKKEMQYLTRWTIIWCDSKWWQLWDDIIWWYKGSILGRLQLFLSYDSICFLTSPGHAVSGGCGVLALHAVSSFTPADPRGARGGVVLAQLFHTGLPGHVEPHGLLVVDVDAFSGWYVSLVACRGVQHFETSAILTPIPISNKFECGQESRGRCVQPFWPLWSTCSALCAAQWRCRCTPCTRRSSTWWSCPLWSQKAPRWTLWCWTLA